MTKKIFIVIVFFFSSYFELSANSLEMKASLEKKDNGYYLSFLASLSGFDASLFNDEKIYLVDDEMIIDGLADNNKINEKDFLFSQKNIDINGDGDVDDSFAVRFSGDKVYINGRDVPSLLRQSGKRDLIINMRESLSDKFIFLKGGIPLFIEKIDGEKNSLITRITSQNIIKQYNNSLIAVEIISKDEKMPFMEGDSFKKTVTNERVFSDDRQWLVRYVATFNVPVENNKAASSIFLKGNNKNFILRVRYYFALSSSVIIFGEKILYP